MRRTIMADKEITDAAKTRLTSFQQPNSAMAAHLITAQQPQVNNQREALQTLALSPVDITFDVFSAPLAAYQSALGVTEAVTREGFKQVEHMTGQMNQATEHLDEQQDQ